MEKRCLLCSKAYKIKPSRYHKSSYCSRSCMSIGYVKGNEAGNNPNWRGGISKAVARKCLECEVEFIPSAYQLGKFCSRVCQNRNQAAKLRKHPAIMKVAVVRKKCICGDCGVAEIKRRIKRCNACREKKYRKDIVCPCGRSVTVSKTSGNAKFCSKKCSQSYRWGHLNANFRGGITPENQKIRASQEYKEWRTLVFRRDKYTCVWCGQVGGTLHADHIKQFAFFPGLRLDINNGRTLCVACHKKTDTFLKGRLKKTA